MLTLTACSKQVATPSAVASGSNREASDEALISATAAGDKRAMHVLYVRHNVRVYRFVLRLTGNDSLAEDIVSDVFLEVWRRADGFRAKSRVSTWILAIARYKAFSALRGRSDGQLDESAVTAIADPADDAETMLGERDQSMIVRRCLSQLSALHREVLDLVYYHEKSVQEVARIVGVPESTVKTRMFYARKQMQNLLEATGVNLH